MPRSAQLQNADGTPLTAFDFGTVLPGTTSAPQPLQFSNTGDVPVTLRAWVENVSPDDGTLSVSFGGVAVTATTQAGADVLGVLGPADTLSGQASYAVPALSGGVMQVQSRLRFLYF